MLECHKFQNIRHIEPTMSGFHDYFMKSKYRFSLPGITKLKEKRKGTKGIKKCKKLCLSQETLKMSIKNRELDEKSQT